MLVLPEFFVGTWVGKLSQSGPFPSARSAT
jgi:hypothetical protein